MTYFFHQRFSEWFIFGIHFSGTQFTKKKIVSNGHTVKIVAYTGESEYVQGCTHLYIFLESTNQVQIFSTNVSIKEHKELLCRKRIQSCIYKSTGCPFKGPADTMMSHQASCQYRPGYNIIKCEICGDPIHLPKFSKTKFENQKRCFNCRLTLKRTVPSGWSTEIKVDGPLNSKVIGASNLDGHSGPSFQFIWIR